MAELLLLVAVLAVLAGLYVSAMAKKKHFVPGINCTNNMKEVALAFRLWSDDHGVYPMQYRTNNFDGPEFAIQQKIYVYFQAMSNELSTPKILVCPSDDRSPALSFKDLSNTNISYFVGLAADETMPQTLLSGDRKLIINGIPASAGLVMIKSTDTIGWDQTMHRGQGNVALADGSVQGFTSAGLQRAAGQTGTNVMRLGIP